MSGPEPKKYQSKAIEEITDIFSRLLRTDTSLDRRLIFHSPVGSGKTLTMAYALANANESPINKPFIVLWLSPGTGGLHLQSARALAPSFSTAPATTGSIASTKRDSSMCRTGGTRTRSW